MNANIYFCISIGISIVTISKAFITLQNGPLILDPYGSFYASSELNPFAKQLAVPKLQFPHPKLPSSYFQRQALENSIAAKAYGDPLKTGLMASFPGDNQFAGLNIPVKIQQKRKYQKIRVPSPKYSDGQYRDDNMGETRSSLPKSQLYYHRLSEDQRKKLDAYRRKPVLTDDEKSRFWRTGKHFVKSKYGKDPHLSDDVGLRGHVSFASDDDDYDDYDYPKSKSKEKKVHHLSPPYEFGSTAGHKYSISTRPSRPGLYQIDPPKDLYDNRPKFWTQHSDYPSKKFSSPYKYSNPRPTQWKVTPGMINSVANNLMTTRNVGAKMSVDADDGDDYDDGSQFSVSGKVFDEPFSDKPSKDDKNYKKYSSSSENSKLSDKSNGFWPSYSPHISSKPSPRPKFVPNSINSIKNYNKWSDDVANKKADQSDTDYQSGDSKDKTESKSANLSDDEPNTDYEYNDDEHSQENNEKRSRVAVDKSAKPKRDKSDDHTDHSIWENPFETSAKQSSTPTDAHKALSEDEEWSSSGIPGQAGKDYPTLSDVPIRSRFSCAGKPFGFYADVAQKCQVYHQCSPQGSQRFLCPNGTLFNQESMVCEWWYNVNCEISESLYHKNAELYLPNKKKMDEDDARNDARHYDKSGANHGVHDERHERLPNWNANNHNDHRYDNHNHNRGADPSPGYSSNSDRTANYGHSGADRGHRNNFNTNYEGFESMSNDMRDSLNSKYAHRPSPTTSSRDRYESPAHVHRYYSDDNEDTAESREKSKSFKSRLKSDVDNKLHNRVRA